MSNSHVYLLYFWVDVVKVANHKEIQTDPVELGRGGICIFLNGIARIVHMMDQQVQIEEVETNEMREMLDLLNE